MGLWRSLRRSSRGTTKGCMEAHIEIGGYFRHLMSALVTFSERLLRIEWVSSQVAINAASFFPRSLTWKSMECTPPSFG
jgi:hypothetical protein